MAIPPPHAFINVIDARRRSPETLELDFHHAAPAAGESPFFAELYWDGPAPEPGVGHLCLGLFERRARHGEPTCTGPVAAQCLRLSLPELLPDASLRRGRIAFNDAGLYGHHRRLARFERTFDLEAPAAPAEPPIEQILARIDALLATVIPPYENERWGWLPLPRQRWAMQRSPLRAGEVVKLDAGGLKQDRVLGTIEVDPDARCLRLVRYSYYGDDDTTVLEPASDWWDEAARIPWPKGPA